jgi:hypothetical protein
MDLQLGHLDRSKGRLTVHRGGTQHAIYLDELTTALPPHGWVSARAAGPTESTPHGQPPDRRERRAPTTRT